ncbi:MAG: hypothetical protein HYZ49_00905 [Chloroflexi bacterium]|nr:hypothetical protein [Chloroflexota bacterium]
MNSQDMATLCIAGLCFFGIPLLVVVFLAMRIIRSRQRATRIKDIESKFGTEFAALIRKKQIAVGMTKEMVALSWGNPTVVDDKEVTAENIKERWVYGAQRGNQRYVWFTSDKVTRIKT